MVSGWGRSSKGSILGPRRVAWVDIERISDSCGYGVPMMEMLDERDLLRLWKVVAAQGKLSDLAACIRA